MIRVRTASNWREVSRLKYKKAHYQPAMEMRHHMPYGRHSAGSFLGDIDTETPGQPRRSAQQLGNLGTLAHKRLRHRCDLTHETWRLVYMMILYFYRYH